jgi:hypothetical protein
MAACPGARVRMSCGTDRVWPLAECVISLATVGGAHTPVLPWREFNTMALDNPHRAHAHKFEVRVSTDPVIRGTHGLCRASPFSTYE